MRASHNLKTNGHAAVVTPLFGRPTRTVELAAEPENDACDPFQLAIAACAIQEHVPALADDLADAIVVWLELRRVAAGLADNPELEDREARLRLLLELIELPGYEPDPRD